MASCPAKLSILKFSAWNLMIATGPRPGVCCTVSPSLGPKPARSVREALCSSHKSGLERRLENLILNVSPTYPEPNRNYKEYGQRNRHERQECSAKSQFEF